MPDHPAAAPTSTIVRRFTRAQAVWCSLLAGMTAVGGGLMLLQGQGVAARSNAQPLVALESTKPAEDWNAILNPKTPAQPGQWKGIVIHHSGSAMGSAESLTKESLARGFRSLGYHFVIGNGQGATNGTIAVGPRWDEQLAGAHTAGPMSEHYNRTTIGICLIGDGERRSFTREQVESLKQLVKALQKQYGIDDANVHLHRDVAPTTSPGRLFPEAGLREFLAAGA